MRFVRSVVVLLAFAVAAAPMVLDGCVIACDGQPPAQAAGHHSCHQAGGAADGIQLEGQPAPCGHDHRAAVGAVGVGAGAAHFVRIAPTLALIVALAAPLSAGCAAASGSTRPDSSPGPAACSSALPLRI